MRPLLMTLNSKYTHTSLALRLLRQTAGMPVTTAEYTVNQPVEEILSQILAMPADLYAFSVYIFNTRQTAELMADLKAIRPQIPIVCGGPEPAGDPEKFLRAHPEVDAVMVGEGETVFPALLRCDPTDLKGSLFRASCPGVCLLREGKYYAFPPPEPCDLNTLPFPYLPGEPEELRERILYYESSRGCPYRCAYCAASAPGRVRFRSAETVKKELTIFLSAGVRVVKFTDRTFNADRKRAREIWRFLIEHDNGVSAFHFEIAARLLEEEDLTLLNSCRPGQILLEVGIQSLNPETLSAVGRDPDPSFVPGLLRCLCAGPCHVHTDLIAGLPAEDLTSFRHSFDETFALRSDCLQLGFLKVLPGTPMAETLPAGTVVSPHPPYEVLSTPWLPSADLQRIKGVEKVLEWYWNSGFCRNTLTYFMTHAREGMFSFFDGLARFFDRKGALYAAHRPAELFSLLAEYLRNGSDPAEWETAEALLSFDLYSLDRVPTPYPWQKTRSDRELLTRLLRDPSLPERLPPETRAAFSSLTPQQWYRNADAAVFPCAPDGTPGKMTVLFLYGTVRRAIVLSL